MVLLASLLAGLLFGAMAGQGFSAVSRISLDAVVAALQDPFSLFAQRSPGKRQSGRLHPTKSVKGRPHERVLASVRDRPAAPATESPIPGEIPGPGVTIPIVPPQYEMPPEGPIITGQPPFPVPPIPYVPIGNPGPPIIPPPPPPGTPVPPPGTPIPPPETPPGIIVIPEPASWTMMLFGVLALAVGRRRKPVTLQWRSRE